jgi:shikimate dehydrogenase
MTQYIGIIGYPLKHSLSPDFQQAALDYCGLDINYQVWETEAENLLPAVNQLRQPEYIGANVTVPYKEAVIPFIDEADDLANLIGAVNTIVNRHGKLAGSNTDAQGFLKALRENANFEPEGKRAVILGAGGAARAVSFALVQEKLSSLVIANRSLVRAEALVDYLRRYVVSKEMHTELAGSSLRDSKLRQTVQHCQLIVNCTTLGTRYSSQEGQSPLAAEWIPKGALVYDLVYNPLQTPLLRMAKEAGASALGGFHMLVYQGAASFKLWTGREASIDIMYRAAKQSLVKTGGQR